MLWSAKFMGRRLAIGLLCGVVGVFAAAVPAPAAEPAPTPAAEFDQYGGYTAIKSQQPRKGFFTTEKIGNRWWLMTPDGHAFITLAVGVMARNPNDGKDQSGRGYTEYAKLRYGDDAGWGDRWAKDTCERVRSWGFNTIGSFSHEVQSTKMMPYYTTLRLSNYSILQNGPCGIVGDGVPGGGPFPDIYNPEFLPFIDRTMQPFAQGANDPWVIGLYPDQMDELRGFDFGHIHLGYVALMGQREIHRANQQKTKNYYKAEFIRFMQERYPTIEAMNEAWGTSYASFDALWDQHAEARFGPGENPRLKDHPKFREDLDAFEEKVAADYTRAIVKTVRKYDSNHLLFSFNMGRGKPTVLRGLAKGGGFDIYWAGWGGKEYDMLKRPVLDNGSFLSADPDSPLRFEGNIDKVELVKIDHYGEVIKVYDFDRNIWWNHTGNVLAIKVTDVPIPRDSINGWNFQIVGTGKDPDGKTFFYARSAADYYCGSPKELYEGITKVLQGGKKARYARGSFGTARTQEERAKAWDQQLQRIVDERGPTTGDYFRVGNEWFKLSDNGWTYWLERYNFGLVTLKGNAYDGKQATKLGADGKAGTWDDEEADYGDLLTGMSQANKGLYKKILNHDAEATPASNVR
jgi:hypothetical protein